MKTKIFYCFLFILLTRGIGIVFLPILLNESPLLLVLLSPFIHHLILTSSLINGPLFITSGILISLFQCTIGYEFGRRYGVFAQDWSKSNRLLTEKKFKWIQGWLQFSAPFILFLIPGPIVAMVAGITYLKRRVFFSSMIPSQVIWIFACYLLGNELTESVASMKTFMREHWPVLTIIFLVLKALHSWRKKSVL